MAINLESYLGVHAAALKLREQRTELLARNLANADTPGYKAQDLDFRAALAATTAPGSASGTLAATQSAHIPLAGAGVLDPSSTEALRRFQQDQNLEASGKLDSLSLIALGLGPKRTANAQARP